jgi:hypothetical protein
VRRRERASPRTPADGVQICAIRPPEAGCVDRTTRNGKRYGYAVVAFDAAGNAAWRRVAVVARDVQAPEPVHRLRAVRIGPSRARLRWAPPPRTAQDVAGYRVLLLRHGAGAPLSQKDGTVVCRLGSRTRTACEVRGLAPRRPARFAVYAVDDVPNFSRPAVVAVARPALGATPPRPRQVRVTREGLHYTVTWSAPAGSDVRGFRVRLTHDAPASSPSSGTEVPRTGLRASFDLEAGARAYVNVFAVDAAGSFAGVSRPVSAPGATPEGTGAPGGRKPPKPSVVDGSKQHGKP